MVRNGCHKPLNSENVQTVSDPEGSKIAEKEEPQSEGGGTWERRVVACMALQECGQWLKLFPVNQGKFTPDSDIANELAYILTAVNDEGWGHSVIEDLNINEGYAPQGSIYCYNKKLKKRKEKAVVPSSQPHKNMNMDIDIKPEQKLRATKTPPKPPIKTTFLPPKPTVPNNWADCVTTQKSTGMTPYYMVHGIEPLHPFDITKATFLASSITHHLSDSELLAVYAKHDEDLVQIYDKVFATQYASICEFKKKNANHIHNYNFGPEELVLVLNKKIEPDIGCKCKPQYFGPMVVVKQLHSGAYILAEVNRAVSCPKFTAFCLISYHPQSHKHLEITEFIDPKDLGGVEDNNVAGPEVVDKGN
ncbi:hypothetical protein AN958_11775 [Leucoagaricus sp. SymC.cos]|nr:hypothetical protein AN958_11775 [Leucoagaricus sp. SymC.cos]